MKPMLPDYEPAVDAFIGQSPEPLRAKLKELRSLVHARIPGITEKMAWGIPTFCLEGKILCHIGGGKHHVGFYPGPQAILDFAPRLTPYKTSKGTVQFPLDQELPAALVADMLDHLKNGPSR